MKTGILTLCDFAKDYNGQMSLMGTFNVIHSVSFPTFFSFCIAAQFYLKVSETGKKKVRISITDKKDGTILMPQQELQINIPIPPNFDEEKEIMHNIVMNFGNVNLPTEGTYLINFEIDDFKSELELYAILTKNA